MKPDKRNNNDSGNNKRNALGLISIILWALFLTLLFRSCWSSYENAGMVEVPYTTFKEWLEADKIQQANVESGQITFTLREGVEVELPQQEETGGAGDLMNALLPEPPQDETAVTEYVTVRLSGVSDVELMNQLEEHLPDGAYTKPVDNSAYLLNLFLAYILPILVMVGLFLFMFRVGGKGGIGGMGNLGKSNAKVYVEKKTGVTFRDVAGQDEAKESLTEIIDFLHNPQKYTEIGAKLPKGALLVGPPGTGKTLLAKEVSKWLFDEQRGLIRIDMSEYSEKHNVARLIGSPPGYVGYGEGGQLTEAVRRQPYAVVLFDEIEKAHPEVFNTMLQIFDEGHLTDGSGRKVDFRNTIIIMTSNVGSRNVVKKSVQVGYSTVSKSATASAMPQCEYRKALEQTFAPEFLNRIDDIVLFRTLELSDVERIIELELQGLFERTRRLGYKVKITDGAKRRLAAMGYESRYGVRSLKRTLMDNVEEPLSTLIIDGKLHEGDTVVVESDKSHGVKLRVA